MTTNQPIKTLFANDIHRRIEEVIKVDQTKDDILRDEINEYVVTDAIRSHYTSIFDAYRETPNKPLCRVPDYSGLRKFVRAKGPSMLRRSAPSRGIARHSLGHRFWRKASNPSPGR